MSHVTLDVGKELIERADRAYRHRADPEPMSCAANTVPQRRLAVFAEGKFDPIRSKTANAAIRYMTDQVLCVIDSTKAGRTAAEVLGYGGEIPVLATLEEALVLQPDALLLGIAPYAGAFSEDWRPLVVCALSAGLDVISGLHTLLGDDEEFVLLARHHGVNLIDLRRPPTLSRVLPTGRWRERRSHVVLTAGTDINVGKMTILLEVYRQLRTWGVACGAVATGQTGLLVLGRGVAIDALQSDFVAGNVDRQIDALDNEGHDVILVEGQGSLTSLAFSGVTLGLLHGSMPDQIVLCHQPARVTDYYGIQIPGPAFQFALCQMLMRPFKSIRLAGVGLNPVGLGAEEAALATDHLQADLKVPVEDVLTAGARRIAESVLQAAFAGSRNRTC